MEKSPNNMNINLLARHFRYSAVHFFKASTLYTRLCWSISENKDLLELCLGIRKGQPASYLLLGAVHNLILEGSVHPLASIYSRFSEDHHLPNDPFPLFRDFCLTYKDILLSTLETRLVHTNEVGRTAYLCLALAHIEQKTGGHPLCLVDLGASAGLLLHWNNYDIEIGVRKPSGQWQVLNEYGDQNSPLRLRCELRGERAPSLRPSSELAVSIRIGIDLEPPDIYDSVDSSWLHALVWPGQTDRTERLQTAVKLLQKKKPTVLRADASKSTYAICSAQPQSTLLCIFHSYVVSQMTKEDKKKLAEQIRKIAAERDLVRIAVESLGGYSTIKVTWWKAGQLVEEETLAECDPHGYWVDWQATSSVNLAKQPHVASCLREP